MKSERFINISILRDKKNITQQELAELSGISLRTIQRIEKGEVIPRPYTIRKLQEALETNFDSENEKTNMAGKLKVFNLIQLSSFFLPLIFVIFGYLFWKRNNWDEKSNLIYNKLVSLSLITAVLIPIFVVIIITILRNYNLQVSYGHIPSAAILYWVFCFIYILIINKLIFPVIKDGSSSLPGLPTIFG